MTCVIWISFVALEESLKNKFENKFHDMRDKKKFSYFVMVFSIVVDFVGNHGRKYNACVMLSVSFLVANYLLS